MELSGKELLISRRSVRNFKKKDVPDDIILKIVELSKYAPSSYNSQSFYFVVIKNPTIREKLGNIRPGGSDPILRAPVAVAVCSDPNKTSNPAEDACIAAYQFMLAAHYYGLGTCWIADMNRKEVKELINIPETHFISTVMPLGYPEGDVITPKRKNTEEFIKWLK